MECYRAKVKCCSMYKRTKKGQLGSLSKSKQKLTQVLKSVHLGPPENTQSAQSAQSKHRVTQSEHSVILGLYLEHRVNTE